MFPLYNGLNEGDVLSPQLFNFASEYAIRIVQENQVGLNTSAAGPCWWCVPTGRYIDSIRKNIETITGASKEVGLEVNSEKTKYILSRHQNAG
jgi:hypothetical protein